MQHQKAEGGNAGVDIKILKAGVDSKTTNATIYKGLESRAASPSWVAKRIKALDAIFLLDEIDSIQTQEKWKIAELVKQLSDVGSGLKFLIVGIAETSSELTDGHESVQRCLKETHLKKMRDSEIEEIINIGEIKLGLIFSSIAKGKIVSVSSGYPHFAHLLALKSAEFAIGEDSCQWPLTLKCWPREFEPACGNDSASNSRRLSEHSTFRKFPSTAP